MAAQLRALMDMADLSLLFARRGLRISC
jgi:hypothetical protein